MFIPSSYLVFYKHSLDYRLVSEFSNSDDTNDNQMNGTETLKKLGNVLVGAGDPVCLLFWLSPITAPNRGDEKITSINR